MRRCTLPILVLSLLAAGNAEAEPPPGLEAALQAQRELAAQQPGDPAVLNDLGNLLTLAGEAEEAEATYREALGLAPESVPARFNLALLLQQEGRLRAAWRELRQVLEAQPDYAWAHYQAGSILAARGRRARALEHYAEALSLDPRLAQPAFNPQIIENRHATSALLMAHRRSTGAESVPRTYERPAEIAGLLLPGAAPPTAAEEEAEPSAKGTDSAPPAPDGSDEPAAPREPLGEGKRPSQPDN